VFGAPAGGTLSLRVVRVDREGNLLEIPVDAGLDVRRDRLGLGIRLGDPGELVGVRFGEALANGRLDLPARGLVDDSLGDFLGRCR